MKKVREGADLIDTKNRKACRRIKMEKNDQAEAQQLAAQPKQKDPGAAGSGGTDLKGEPKTRVYGSGNKDITYASGAGIYVFESGRMELYAEDGRTVVAETTPREGGYVLEIKDNKGNTVRRYSVETKTPMNEKTAFRILGGTLNWGRELNPEKGIRWRFEYMSPERLKEMLPIDLPGES